jgi:LPXTG-site transpeptidase (sortase) family protein
VPRTPADRRRLLPALVTLLGVALAGAGVAVWLTQPQDVAPRVAPQTVATSDAADAAPVALPQPDRAPWEPGAPRRLMIPALEVDAPVLPITAPNRTLIPPSDPQQLGWWSDGARPGDVRGSALVTGHTVHTGGGALDDLETVEPGDRVVVRTSTSRLTYVVRTVRIYDKGALAREAARVFSQEVPGRLVVITCEDWDGSQYLSNVVVVAEPRR